MSVLDVVKRTLPGLATAAGQGYAGFARDQENDAASVIAADKAKREAENDRVRNLVSMGGIDPKLQGQLAGAKVTGETSGLVDRAKLMAPVAADAKRQEIVATAQPSADAAGLKATAEVPAQTATHAANRQFDILHPETHYATTTIGGDPNVPGSGEVVSVNTNTGQRGPTIGTAKPNVSSAKLTDPQEKSYLFYGLMKNSEPVITKALGSNNVRQGALTAYLNSPEKAAPLVYATMNNDEHNLIQAMRQYSAGVLRKESGAAVTHDELRDTFARFFPAFGEAQGPGSVSETKAAARRDYLQMMQQEAGPAIDYYAQREAHRAAGGHPTGAVTPAPVAAGGKPGTPSFEEWLAKRGGTP